MPIRRDNDFKIAAGHLSDVDSDDYLIANFPIQTDQGRAKWSAPQDALPPAPAEQVEMQDGSVLPSGDIIFQWTFSYWTFDMYQYWCETFLPSGVRFADVTVQVFDDFDEPKVYQAIMQHRYQEDRQKAPGGYSSIIFRFVSAVDITP